MTLIIRTDPGWLLNEYLNDLNKLSIFEYFFTIAESFRDSKLR
jgi:hypothetical protein